MLVLGSRAAGQRACGSQPYQIFQQLLRHRHVLARPAVAAAMSSEAEALSGLAATYLEHLQEGCNQRARVDASMAGAAVAALVWLRQAAHKVDVTGQVLAAFSAHPAIAASTSTHTVQSQRSSLAQEVASLSKARLWVAVLWTGIMFLQTLHAPRVCVDPE